MARFRYQHFTTKKRIYIVTLHFCDAVIWIRDVQSASGNKNHRRSCRGIRITRTQTGPIVRRSWRWWLGTETSKWSGCPRERRTRLDTEENLPSPEKLAAWSCTDKPPQTSVQPHHYLFCILVALDIFLWTIFQIAIIYLFFFFNYLSFKTTTIIEWF